MPPILVSSSTKRIATQILVIAELNERKYFILTGFLFDMKRTASCSRMFRIKNEDT